MESEIVIDETGDHKSQTVFHCNPSSPATPSNFGHRWARSGRVQVLNAALRKLDPFVVSVVQIAGI